MSWRRRGDSNSRYRSPHTNDLANRPLQPLGYSSVLLGGALAEIIFRIIYPLSPGRLKGTVPSDDLRFTQQPLGFCLTNVTW
ncbi:MAG: hypothetical protein QG549_865 [Patescibacteria group bacterium]|nr:hypothetical protein [Patescibacteria group bacterium]